MISLLVGIYCRIILLRSSKKYYLSFSLRALSIPQHVAEQKARQGRACKEILDPDQEICQSGSTTPGSHQGFYAAPAPAQCSR